MAGNGDGIIILRINDGQLLVHLIMDASGEWAVGASNGFWDASPGGIKYVGVNKTGTLEVYLPSDEVCKRLYFKGLLAYIWAKGRLP